jgi:hypothetical protein
VQQHLAAYERYFSWRVASGNAHSRENPSLAAGAAGGSGAGSLDCAVLPPSRLDFVSVPIFNSMKAGGSHAQRVTLVSELLDRVRDIIVSGMQPRFPPFCMPCIPA